MDGAAVASILSDDPELRARARLRSYLREADLSQARFAVQVGWSRSAISQFLSGTYKADTKDLVRAIDAFLDQAPAVAVRHSPRAEAADGFVETKAAELVLTLVKLARGMRDIALLYGDPGVGKTAALEHYRAQHPSNVLLVTAAPHHLSATAILGEIAQVLELPKTRSSLTLFESLKRALLERPDVLIIVDEAQHLPLEAIEELRSLHDATGVPLVLAGNDVVYDQVRGSGGPGFAQLYSRVAIAQRVEGDITAEDVRAIAGEELDDEMVGFLVERGNAGGALRTVSKCLRLARLMAEAAGGALALGLLQAAYAMQIEGQRKRPVAARRGAR